MLDFLTGDWVTLAASRRDRLRDLKERLLGTTERGILKRPRLRAMLATGLVFLGMASILNFFRLIMPNLLPGPFRNTQVLLLEAGLGTSHSYLYWYSILGGFHGVTGLLLLAGAAMLVTRRERPALGLSYYVLLVHLTILDLLMFYYFQFDTILFAILQFGLVLAVSHYRKQYLENDPLDLMV
jgi:hypothetical protein